MLIVEPDPNVQWRLARMLTLSGLRVVGTSSLSGARMLISRWPVDLILLSQTITSENGNPLTAGLNDHDARLPVVLIANEDDDSEGDFVSTTGMVHRIRHPFTQEKVTRLVRVLLADRLESLPAE